MFVLVRPLLGMISEAGIPLPDHRTPPERVDDLAVRFSALSIDPEVPPPIGPPQSDAVPGSERRRELRTLA